MVVCPQTILREVITLNKLAKKRGKDKPPYPPPEGFEAFQVEGRWVYSAKKTNIILAWHESMIEELCEKYAVPKISLPDALDCVRPHVRHRFLLKLDLANAYDQVSWFGLFVMLGIQDDFDRRSEWFCHRKGGLIQGAPASSALFHYYIKEMLEEDLDKLAREYGLTWTRYVDDFLFSSNKFITKQVLKAIIELLKSGGFPVNWKKRKAIDRHQEELEFLGVVFKRNEVGLPSSFLEKLDQSEYGSKNKKEGLLLWQRRVLDLNKM